jgi:hypothetical protein
VFLLFPFKARFFNFIYHKIQTFSLYDGTLLYFIFSGFIIETVTYLNTFTIYLSTEMFFHISYNDYKTYRSDQIGLKIKQAPQTRGPRAACGPREGSMRPPNIFSDQEIIEV